MPPSRICKTVHQYNKDPVSEENMRKLLDIAEDYQTVKNYVYRRYGGITGLSKIYPGYTVQNEMTVSGQRERLELPSVYFYLAIFEALGEIKSRWTKTKTKIVQLVGQHENFTEQEKHYLRFLLKVNNAFEAVLNRRAVVLTTTLQKQYESLAGQVDVERLNRYLCRQVRKHHGKLHTKKAEGFAVSERAYRYADHGIYLTIKEKRKRVFIRLTDNNQYQCQLYIRLYPSEGKVEIKVPINVRSCRHVDYHNQIGVAVGFYTMLTTDQGSRYGEALGRYQLEYSEWMRVQMSTYSRNRKNNPGRKKYYAKKQRLEENLHSYINHELNRFLQTEKPQTVYIIKFPKPQAVGENHKTNYSLSRWQRGYIRKRLEQKCREQSVELIKVFGKDISNVCSQCGAFGKKQEGNFYCPVCHYQVEEKMNTARNIKRRGQKLVDGS